MYYEENYGKVTEAVMAEIQKTLTSIDPKSVERLAQDIMAADQVFFVTC